MKKVTRVIVLSLVLNLFSLLSENVFNGTSSNSAVFAQGNEVIVPSTGQHLFLCWYVRDPTTLVLGGICKNSGNCYGDNGICG